MIFLKQSTASQEVLLGPFVDATDGNTAETALTIANTDIKIHKAGATTLANKNSGGATHISNGNYYAVLDATDTDTVGSGAIVVQVSGALAVRVNFCVLPANAYDSLIGGTDTLNADVTQISGSNVSTSTAQLGVNVVNFGGSAGTFASGRPEVNTSHIAGSAVSTTSAQIGVNVVQISADSVAADNCEAFFDGTGYAGTNNVIPTVTTATNVTTVNGLAANVITAAATAADFTTEIQTGLATAAALATVDGIVDNLVSGIIFGTAATGTLSTTQASTDLSGYANDQLIGRVIIWLTGNCEGEASDITDYVSTNGVLTFTALTTAPANGDTFKIV